MKFWEPGVVNWSLVLAVKCLRCRGCSFLVEKFVKVNFVFVCRMQNMGYWVELELLGCSRFLFGVRQVGNYMRLCLRWNVAFISMMTMTYHMIFTAIIAYQILSIHCWIFSQKIYGNNSGIFGFLWSALRFLKIIVEFNCFVFFQLKIVSWVNYYRLH